MTVLRGKYEIILPFNPSSHKNFNQDLFFTQGVFPNDNDQIPMSVTLMRVWDPPNANISPRPSPPPSSYESDDNDFLFLILKFYESRYL